MGAHKIGPDWLIPTPIKVVGIKFRKPYPKRKITLDRQR